MAKDEKWVEVTDDPASRPQTDEVVLVSCQTKKGAGAVKQARYIDGAWRGSGLTADVIAWQPLPQPYVAGKHQ